MWNNRLIRYKYFAIYEYSYIFAYEFTLLLFNSHQYTKMSINKHLSKDIDLEILKAICVSRGKISFTDAEAAQILGISRKRFSELKENPEYYPKNIPGLESTRNTYETLSRLWKAAQTAKYE